MFVVYGINNNGNISWEFFFNNKKNIMDKVIMIANYDEVESIIVKKITIDEKDNSISDIILSAEASYLKK